MKELSDRIKRDILKMQEKGESTSDLNPEGTTHSGPRVSDKIDYSQQYFMIQDQKPDLQSDEDVAEAYVDKEANTHSELSDNSSLTTSNEAYIKSDKTKTFDKSFVKKSELTPEKIIAFIEKMSKEACI